MQKQLVVDPIKEALGSIASFSTIIYLIILTLSICYNIGYLKQINPQIIDLMEVGDYINDTTHNIWFFFLGALIFFSSSLAFVRIRVGIEFTKILVFGVFAFIVSVYFLLKGIYYSKFWPTIKLIESNYLFHAAFTVMFILFIAVLFIVFYGLTKIIKRNESTLMSAEIIPIFTFIMLVLMPYIGGMNQGYIENKYLTKDDYDAIHSVNIHIVPDNKVLKDVYIIKKFNKGLIIRQFSDEDNQKDKFKFINWIYIQSISYKRIEELPSPL